jgi:alpha-1,3-rhamnosyl/mannosyltransferase
MRPNLSAALRVAFNATPLASPLTGIGNYIVRLAAALSATGEVDVHAYDGASWHHGAPSPRVTDGDDSSNSRLRDIVRPYVPFARDVRQWWRQATFGHGMRANAIDLYHEPNYVAFRTEVPTVVTIHDLSFIRYPETHPRDRVRWLERGLPRTIERAAAIVVDSQFTRQELLETFAVPATRVHAIPLGAAPAFRPRAREETATYLGPLGLTHGSYVLTVGTLEPRKNLSHVLAAYEMLPARLRERYPLVVAGARGWRADELEARLRELTVRERIRFLGHVSDGDLPLLYSGAGAFVFPSLYEGFGLPPLEAMASGVPILVADRAALPEVAGNCAVLLDPERPDETARSIERLLEGDALRIDMAQRGLRRAASYTWEACARSTLEVYRATLQACGA